MLSRSFGDSHPVRAPANLNQILQKPKTASPELQQPAQPTMPGFTPPLGDNDQTGANTAPSVTPPPVAQSKPVTTNPSMVKPAPAQIPKPQQQAMTQPRQTQALASPAQKLAALANGGNVKAQAVLGFSYLDGTNGVSVNEAEGGRWLERAANSGDAMAAYRLGTLYERGHGVPTDAGKAVQFYSIAAKQGNRKAMHNLAVAFAEGSGVPKNLQQASQWFTRAAELGLSDSQFNLAVLYERGMGVQQSLTEAYKWYSIAAAQGDTESKARVDALATQLAPADKAAAQKAADSFRPKPMNAAANAVPSPSDFAG